jgi:hypothetical protein
LEERRRNTSQARSEEQGRKDYLRNVVGDTSLPEHVRRSAEAELHGAKVQFEPPPAPDEPKLVTVGGMPYEYRPGQGLTPVAGTPEPAPPAPEVLSQKDRISFAQSTQDDFRQDAAGVFLEPLRRYGDVADLNPETMTGAQQRTLVVTLAKMSDPTSAVMEGEADAVAKAGETMPWIKDLYRSAIDGNLPVERLRQLQEEARRLAQNRHAELKPTYDRYSTRLAQLGIEDPETWIGAMPKLPGGGGGDWSEYNGFRIRVKQ